VPNLPTDAAKQGKQLKIKLLKLSAKPTNRRCQTRETTLVTL